MLDVARAGRRPEPEAKSIEPMFALLIPTHNRSGFLKRVLEYYTLVPPEFPVHVVDSSGADHAVLNRGFVDEARRAIGISYHGFDPQTDFLAKVNAVLDELQVPFVGFCADDDYVIPSAAADCARFLHANPDYAIAHGIATVVRCSTPPAPGGPPGIEIRPYRQRSIEHATAADRVRDHLKHYSTTFYSVIRRSLLARCLHLAYSQGQDGRFGELTMSSLGVIHGKVKKLDQLYIVREAHASAGAASAVRMNMLRSGEDFQERRDLFEAIVSQELASTSGMDLRAAQRLIHGGFQGYLDRYGVSRQGPLLSNALMLLRRSVREQLLEASDFAREKSCWDAETRRLTLPCLLDPSSEFHKSFEPVYRNFLRDCETRATSGAGSLEATLAKGRVTHEA